MSRIRALPSLPERGQRLLQGHAARGLEQHGVARTGQTTSFHPGDDGDLRAGAPWPTERFYDHGDGTVTTDETVARHPTTFQVDANAHNGRGAGTDIGYYCDTEGGNSGSPVLSRETHKVVALHHCANCPNRGVRIQDIADPAAPVEVGRIETPVEHYDHAVQGHLVYVFRDDFSVMDVSDPAAPVELGSCPTDFYGHLLAAGDVVWLDDEGLMDAVTAISGTGPAYFFLLAEVLAESAREMGLPGETADRLASITCFGAGAMLASSPGEAAELRRRVTSPNGTTHAAMTLLGREGLLELSQLPTDELLARLGMDQVHAGPPPERLAIFERAQSPENWTKPSVASVLTSLHPATHGTKKDASKN